METKENGFLALERLKKAILTQEFDVLITDLQMPVLDGFECVKQFRSYESNEAIPLTTVPANVRKCHNRKGQFLIIGMSANSDAVSKQDAFNAGMDGFICKPFTYQDFVDTLTPLL